MSEKKFEHSIELIGGYEKDSVIHSRVTFGRRLTVCDLMNIEDDPQSSVRTQHEDLIRRRIMTEFGTIKTPTLPMLLSLNRVDRQDIAAAADHFLQISRGERKADYLDGHKVKLYFGFQIADVVYDVVQFGNFLSGNDEVEADRLGLVGIRRLCFELGRQISRLESSEHSLVLEGKVDLDAFETLDGDDFQVLSIGGEMFTQSFRLKRKEVSGEQDGRGSVSAGKGDGMVGKPNTRHAKGKD